MKPSVLSSWHAELDRRIALARRRRDPDEVRMEYLPVEMCGAISPPPDEEYCTLLDIHKGPHSWQRRKP